MIGNGVTIKAGAIIYGCTIADGSVVGEEGKNEEEKIRCTTQVMLQLLND